MLLEFITKYWLEVLFSIICSSAAFFMKHYVKLIKKDKERHEKDIIEALEKKMDEQKDGMSKQMDNCYNKLLGVVQEAEEKSYEEDKIIHQEIKVIKNSLLSFEEKTFKDNCRNLLKPYHTITLDEYEDIQSAHTIYNELGGNHDGDALFKMVRAKYEKTLEPQSEDDYWNSQ